MATSVPPAEGEYLRRLHTSVSGWYAIAETKAQLILAFNGAFVTVLIGAIFGKAVEVRALVGVFGPETWVLLMLSFAAPIGAVVCAVACLWSQHGRSRQELAELGVDLRDADTVRPAALWYFAHLAELPADTVVERLRQVDADGEAEAMAHGIARLSRKVLRKHQLINAGWVLSGVAITAITATGVSVLLRL